VPRHLKEKGHGTLALAVLSAFWTGVSVEASKAVERWLGGRSRTRREREPKPVFLKGRSLYHRKAKLALIRKGRNEGQRVIAPFWGGGFFLLGGGGGVLGGG